MAALNGLGEKPSCEPNDNLRRSKALMVSYFDHFILIFLGC